MGLISSSNYCEDCGSSRGLAEYSDNYYCFSCHKTTFKTNKKAYGAVFEDVAGELGPLELPNSATPKLSPEAMQWLWKYHMTDELIEEYNLLYCPYGHMVNKYGMRFNYADRLILPVYDSEMNLVAYQARALTPGDMPKYYTAGDADRFFTSALAEHSNEVILVEDIISAIRVGEVHPCISLLGTRLNTEKFLTLASKYTIIKVWMDGDRPGRQASKKIAGRLSMVCSVSEIKTEKDPKCYTKEEIAGVIEKAS